MNLKYRIYWIDDTPEFAASVQEDIFLRFKSDAIDIEIIDSEDGENIEEIARTTALDLFVLDYNLDGRDGEELIRSLRANGELTEIVFYSMDDAIHEKCKGLEGVHVCGRNDASETLKPVIMRFMDRCNNVAVMRGMIISEAIDVENRLTDIILELFGDKKTLFRNKIIEKPIMDFEKKRMFVQSVLKDHIEDENASSNPDTDKVERMNGLRSTLNEMKKEIVDQRNILAHSEKKFNDGILTLSGLSGAIPIKFDIEWKNTIRSNIKKHMKNLGEIRALLIPIRA